MRLVLRLMIVGLVAAGIAVPRAGAIHVVERDAVAGMGAGTAGEATFAFAVADPFAVVPPPPTPCPPEPIGCPLVPRGSLTVDPGDGSTVSGTIVCADFGAEHVFMDVEDANGAHHAAYAVDSEDAPDRFGFLADAQGGCYNPTVQAEVMAASHAVTGTVAFHDGCVVTPDPPGPVIADPCVGP